MMRSLWTAASGMTSQQLNIDTISNNLANVNTTGYKKERMEFKTLLYQTMQRADQDPANTPARPVNLQVGHGVRPIATARAFTTGSFQRTDNAQDFAIEGDGFFIINRGADPATGEDDITYTRDGSFKTAVVADGTMLTTAEGYPVLSVDGEPIVIPPEVLMKDVTVDENGNMGYANAEGQYEDLGFQFALVQFSNPQGLESVGSNLFKQTVASGEPLSEADGETNKTSRLRQNFLEMSNVAVANEMVDLIIAQRAYDLNSKVITTSDEMLQTANALKR
ncbi:MAG: flagellar basal-body rod protein FlgG [Clostridiales bacterium]|jgi:flagellar basal-body rod protein FlgG|nr:flagellar basal-body rod protein FlgG [Clostridiales bacterium]